MVSRSFPLTRKSPWGIPGTKALRVHIFVHAEPYSEDYHKIVGMDPEMTKNKNKEKIKK